MELLENGKNLPIFYFYFLSDLVKVLRQPTPWLDTEMPGGYFICQTVVLRLGVSWSLCLPSSPLLHPLLTPKP